MGGGTWTTSSFASYTTSVGRSYDATLDRVTLSSSQETFTAKTLDPALNPYNVMRECRDSEEHPFTIPVIFVDDVTGSMGDAAVEVAATLNRVITALLDKVKHIQFCTMAIGDLAFDRVGPIQITQFESDVRIAEQMDKIYFEYGGGGNSYESYTAAWYMGSRHCDLDCWKRGKKGIIITIGDEELNPYLPEVPLERVTGDTLQGDVETKDLYKEASEKFDIYHINVDHSHWQNSRIHSTWKEYLDDDHYKSVKLNAVADTIIDMILNAVSDDAEAFEANMVDTTSNIQKNENGEIYW